MLVSYIVKNLVGIKNYCKNNIILLFLSSLLIVLLSSWNFFGSMYPFVFTTSSEFQSQNSWMPLIKAISEGNLFPEMPGIDINQSSLLFYPYITLLLNPLIFLLITPIFLKPILHRQIQT